MSRLPETQYAYCGGLSIAYQVMGDGPIDIVMVPGILSHVEFFHELPGYTRFLELLASFGRVITFDKRGQGLSDRISGAPSMEERMDDVRAVMAAAGSERAALIGFSEGGALAIIFAATYPDKVSHLIPSGGWAKGYGAPDYPYRESLEERKAKARLWMENWGEGVALRSLYPALAEDPEMRTLFGRAERLSCTPSGIRHFFELNLTADIRPALKLVSTPTLILHRRDDHQVPFACGEHLAREIPGARLVGLKGDSHLIWYGDVDSGVEEIRAFITGSRRPRVVSERVLATVLFTDIVGSTKKMTEMGDERWHMILDDHDAIGRRLVEEYQGRFIKTTGDGLVATFDGPGRAIQCACAFAQDVERIGLDIRAGLHTGEVELRGDDIAGLAVHVASRIQAQADAGEVLVSKLVTDLVAGSVQFDFTDRGQHVLKGVPGTWQLLKARN